METVAGSSMHGEISARAVARHTGIPYTTVWLALRRTLRCYKYKIHRHHELLPGDSVNQRAFAVWAFQKMAKDDDWLSNFCCGPTKLISRSEGLSTHTSAELGLLKILELTWKLHCTTRKSRSPDLSSCVYWLWVYLKSQVYRDRPTSLGMLKDNIRLQCLTITPDMLYSAVHNIIPRPQLLLRNGGEHIEHFLNESRLNLRSDDNRVRVWRLRGERLNLAFALHRHAAPTAGVMVRDAIAYNTWSFRVLISNTMTAQRYVHDILQPTRDVTHATAPWSQFSTRQCSVLHGKGVTRLSLQCYYPSLAFRIPRFVSNLGYLE
ncbi:DUF4817 domain-containing protein [Trichonephila clavipes]|nr:DUF4817 domain-containing protein [Trichonephila clavipes]